MPAQAFHGSKSMPAEAFHQQVFLNANLHQVIQLLLLEIMI